VQAALGYSAGPKASLAEKFALTSATVVRLMPRSEVGPEAARNFLPRVRHASVQRREVAGFESLVRDLSAAMTRTPADSVDPEIDIWLGKICEALDLDRAAIYERDTPSGPVHPTHIWVRSSFPPFPQNFDPERMTKRTVDWILAGNQFAFSRPSDIPAEMDDLRRFVEKYGPQASALFPMWAGDRIIGGASFGKFRSPREWYPELLECLGFAVRLFGGAIERKQSEFALRAVRAELRVASRRNIMSELVASLTHEINQPVSAIMSNLAGLARLLSQKSPDSTVALTVVRDATEDAQRTAEIIRRIRSMFKGEAQRKSPILLGPLIGEVMKLISSEAGFRKIEVQVDIPASVPRVMGDPIPLQQCLLNLLINAFDAIDKAKSNQRDVTISVVREDSQWLRISVNDSGAGIDPSVAPRLFQPFVTTKNEGMGLGLVVSRSIVESHGGKIWAAPNPDRGTTFSFTLPIAARSRVRSKTRRSGEV
jgi:signal transduction histidine kinase